MNAVGLDRVSRIRDMIEEALRSLDKRSVASMIDATILKPNALADDIRGLVEEAAEEKYSCVMVAPTHLPVAYGPAVEYSVRLCTVIGYPLGLQPLQSKLAEIEYASGFNVREIDVVPDYSRLGEEGELASEIASIVDKARDLGIETVKIIVEVDLFDEDGLEEIVDAAAVGGANYVKTSTGVYTKGGGYTTVKKLHGIASKYGLRVKASGGIRTSVDAVLAIMAGASRIGTSTPRRVLEGFKGA